MFRRLIISLITLSIALGCGGGGGDFTTPIIGPTLNKLGLSPAVVQGGSSTTVTGTVTLSSPATGSGVTVAVSSLNTAVATTSVSFVTVSGGATQAFFQINTSAVSTSTQVTISSNYNGVTKSAQLTVTP